MFTKWTSHIADEQQRQDFRKSVVSAKSVLERQKEILEDEERSLDRSEIDIRQFDQPNWRERQAYKNGYRAALYFQKKLIDLDQQDTTQTETNL